MFRRLPAIAFASFLIAAIPAATAAAGTGVKSSAIRTHFLGKVANKAPLKLTVKVKAGKIVAITSLISSYSAFNQCFSGVGKFDMPSPIKVSGGLFKNTQALGIPGLQVGGTPLGTIQGKFSHNNTRVAGTLKLVDPTGQCASQSLMWSAKASS
jgi:hypothetical protein